MLSPVRFGSLLMGRLSAKWVYGGEAVSRGGNCDVRKR
jgi:hypothetical protein